MTACDLFLLAHPIIGYSLILRVLDLFVFVSHGDSRKFRSRRFSGNFLWSGNYVFRFYFWLSENWDFQRFIRINWDSFRSLSSFTSLFLFGFPFQRLCKFFLIIGDHFSSVWWDLLFGFDSCYSLKPLAIQMRPRAICMYLCLVCNFSGFTGILDAISHLTVCLDSTDSCWCQELIDKNDLNSTTRYLTSLLFLFFFFHVSGCRTRSTWNLLRNFHWSASPDESSAVWRHGQHD